VKDPLELILAVAVIWTAAPQSTDATDAIVPIVLESVKRQFYCKTQRKEGRLGRTTDDPSEEVAPLWGGIRVGPKIELDRVRETVNRIRDAAGPDARRDIHHLTWALPKQALPWINRR
jgi:hypothetical protein